LAFLSSKVQEKGKLQEKIGRRKLLLELWKIGVK